MGPEPRGLRSTQTLPRSYAPIWALDLTRNPKTALVLNLISLPLFVLFACVFGFVSSFSKPEISIDLHVVLLPLRNDLFLLFLLAAIVSIMILHEAVHGFFFWVYTHAKPRFGLRILFAYAGAPGWYIPRNEYSIIGLAPLLLISVAGLILIPFVPLPTARFILLLITVNAAGAVGDLYIVGKTLRQPRTVLIQDTGAGFTMFGETKSVV